MIDLHLADFRDPSVFWDEKRGHWLMTVSLPTQHKVRFYSSSNLKQWIQLSDFGPAGDAEGAWECPDLLLIPPERGKENMWALKVGLNPGAHQGGSGEQYFLGKFDGTRLVALDEPGAHGWTNYGKDDYCAISFNGLPPAEKPVLIGWMNNWEYAAKLPTSPWRGQMSIPRRLSFVRDRSGLALKQEPIIAPIRAGETDVSEAPGGKTESHVLPAPFELEVRFDDRADRVFGVRLFTDEQHWTEIGFDRPKGVFYMDRTKSGATLSAGLPGKYYGPARCGPHARSQTHCRPLLDGGLRAEGHDRNEQPYFSAFAKQQSCIFHFNRQTCLCNGQNLATPLDLEVRHVF